MVEMTEADITAALKHMGFDSVADLHYWAQDNNELNRFDALTQAFATHREAAAKAERDRIVAWLRSDGPDRDNGGPCRHVEHSQGTCICNELADALESQP